MDAAAQQEAEQLKALVAESPGDVHSRQRLADVLAALGRTSEAVEQLQAVAGRFAAQGRLLQAMAVNLLVLELDPDHTETQEALAELYAQQRESVPIVPRLPVSMAQALHDPGQPAGARGHAPLAIAVGGLLRRATPLPHPSRGGILAARPAPQAPARPVALNVGALNRTPLFSALDRASFVALLGETELRVVLPGEIVVEEGKTGTSMFVVVQGGLEVLRGRGPDGKPLKGGAGALLARLGDGDFFGEMALVANSPRLATVRAAEESILLEIDREALEHVIVAHPFVREVVQAFYRARLLDNLFGQSNLFRDFSPEERRVLGARFRHHSLPQGAVLLEQGQPGSGLCILLRGRCSAVHTATSGSDLEAQPLREGDVFGEISLLFDTPCTATVAADTAVEVLELPRDAFNDLVLTHPSVRLKLAAIAQERLDRTRAQLSAAGEWVSSTLV